MSCPSTWIAVWIYATGASVWRSAGGAVASLASQAVGAKQYDQASAWLLCGLVVSGAAMFPLAALWIFAGPILAHLGFSELDSENAGVFCQWFCIGLPATLVIYAVNGWLLANRIVMPQLVISVVMVFINVGLNQLLIHGVGSWAGLGYIGSPLSTTLCRWINVIILTVYLAFAPGRHREVWTGFHWGKALTRTNMYELGCTQWLPKVAAGTVSEIQTQLMGWLAAQLGQSSVSAHSAVQNLFFCITAACYSAASAAGTRVGNRLGAGQPRWAAAVYRLTVMICGVSGVVVSAALLATHDVIGRIYSQDDDVVTRISQITLIVGIAWLPISLMYGFYGILGGQARATAISIVSLVASWLVAVPIAFGLQYGLHGGLGVRAMWIGSTSGNGVTLLALGYLVVTSDWERLADEAVARSRKKRDAKAAADSDAHAVRLLDDDAELDLEIDGAAVRPSAGAGTSSLNAADG